MHLKSLFFFFGCWRSHPLTIFAKGRVKKTCSFSDINHTGCKIVSVKKYLFPIQARNHHMSWARCLFSPYTRTFWYMISKKFYDHWLIIHFKKLWRGKNGKFCKIRWKWRIKLMSVLFCKYLRNKSSDLYEIWYFYS